MIRCLFEQSGTFKKVFNDIGISALDYDIDNKFNTTDVVCDLFIEISNWFDGKKSIFDTFKKDDFLFCFFPCTRFSKQINLVRNGSHFTMRNYPTVKKILYNININNEVSYYFDIFSKFFVMCLRTGLRCIIENPYSNASYLIRYFPVKPSFIDYDRSLHGDFFVKPTMYYFINCDVNCSNVFNDYVCPAEKKSLVHTQGIDRSLISSIYAKYFINTFVLPFLEGSYENI